jgi:acetyl/propionyl-CoA carboxylase alpha subunit
MLVDARHVEVQVLGDAHGNLIHLSSASARSSAGGRSCSRSRRLLRSTPARVTP